MNYFGSIFLLDISSLCLSVLIDRLWIGRLVIDYGFRWYL